MPSGQELERYKAAELGVLGLVDHTHAAAKLLQDAVVGDCLADHRCISLKEIFEQHDVAVEFVHTSVNDPFAVGGNGEGSAARRGDTQV